jgi:hypothetical protein
VSRRAAARNTTGGPSSPGPADSGDQLAPHAADQESWAGAMPFNDNIPVFFIQDAMKFPDLIHAVKPEPHNAILQAQSAHDTFWDFASLSPESTHMLLWVMSDRAIPRSYRMMQGFGVHTFRLVNARRESVFCKFHWKPLLGTHSLVWDEALKLGGADPDFHRRDLWEAIEAGDYPEWELGLQVFTEEQADGFSFDVLDATKLIPEELVPVRPVGRVVLDSPPSTTASATDSIARRSRAAALPTNRTRWRAGARCGRRTARTHATGDRSCASRRDQNLAGTVAVLGIRLGRIDPGGDGGPLEADASLENSPAVLFDAVVLPDGRRGVETLSADGRTLEFIKDQYRHGKSIFAVGAGVRLLERAGIEQKLPGGSPDPGLIIARAASAAAAVRSFIAAVGKHRHAERHRDPPPI